MKKKATGKVFISPILIRLTPAQNAKLKAIASSEERTRCAVVREAIDRWIDTYEFTGEA